MKQKKKKRMNRRQRIRLTLFLVLGYILLLQIVLLGKMFRRDPLKGIWTLDQATVYEFDGLGHGKLSLPLNSYEFSYILEDNTLAIDFSNESITDAGYSYVIEGSSLTLDSNTGTVFNLEKQK